MAVATFLLFSTDFPQLCFFFKFIYFFFFFLHHILRADRRQLRAANCKLRINRPKELRTETVTNRNPIELSRIFFK